MVNFISLPILFKSILCQNGTFTDTITQLKFKKWGTRNGLKTVLISGLNRKFQLYTDFHFLTVLAFYSPLAASTGVLLQNVFSTGANTNIRLKEWGPNFFFARKQFLFRALIENFMRTLPVIAY